MRKYWFILIFLAAGYVYGAVDNIVAYVGKRPILESEVQRKAAEDGVDQKEALTSLITERLLVTEAEAEKITISREELLAETERIRKSFPDEAMFRQELEKSQISYAAFQKNIEERLRARKLITEKIVRQIAVSPADLAAAYAQEKQNSGDEYLLKGMVFTDKSSAETFCREWRPEFQSRMEDIGWAKKNELLPAIMESVAGLKKGEITGPVLVMTKWHVFLLVDMRQAAATEEEMLAKANNRLFQKEYREKLTAYLIELQKKIPVKIVNEQPPA